MLRPQFVVSSNSSEKIGCHRTRSEPQYQTPLRSRAMSARKTAGSTYGILSRSRCHRDAGAMTATEFPFQHVALCKCDQTGRGCGTVFVE